MVDNVYALPVPVEEIVVSFMVAMNYCGIVIVYSLDGTFYDFVSLLIREIA